MSEHFKEVCIGCGAVTNQCRCMDPNKTVRDTVCVDCARMGMTLPDNKPLLPHFDLDIPMPPVKPPKSSGSVPHKCPCCGGWGKRPDPSPVSSSAVLSVPCAPCAGTGIVWSES